MEVIVHYPSRPEAITALSDKAGAVHAQAIAAYIDNLTCPKEQKLQLLKQCILHSAEHCR